MLLANRQILILGNALVRHRSPMALEEHIIAPRSFTVQTDGDALLSGDADEGRAGELRALFGLDDLGLSVTTQGVFSPMKAGDFTSTLEMALDASGLDKTRS